MTSTLAAPPAARVAAPETAAAVPQPARPTPTVPPVVDGSPHRFTAEEYRRMCESGVFDPAARVELLEGTVRDKTSRSPPHVYVVIQLNELFAAARPRGVLNVQSSVQVDGLGVPEPDFTLLRGPKEQYAVRWATPADMLLLVEVARSSLAYDRDEKRPVYARAGVAEFWLVDVEDRVVWVHRKPSAVGYLEVAERRGGQTLSCVALPDVAFAAADLFPAEAPGPVTPPAASG